MRRDERTSFIGPAGVMAMACRHRRPGATRAAPNGDRSWDQPVARERQAGPCGVAERSVLAMKPGNSGGGKGPQLKTNASSNEGQGIDDESSSPRFVFRSCRRRYMPSEFRHASFPRAGCGKSACPVRRAGTGNRAKPNRIAATARKLRQQPPGD